MRALFLALLLAACGGNETPRAFGWWGGAIANEDYLDAPGASLGLILPETLDRVAPMADRARALGLRPVLMLWVLVRSEEGMRSGWGAILDSAVSSCGDCDFYVADEPYLQGWTEYELDAVVSRLPDRMLMLSLSTPEMQSEVHVPERVTLGVNLYSSVGETPASALRYLDTLATYGRPMYLNLDAVVVGSLCKDVTPAQTSAAIQLNEAMRAWASGKVRAYIAFAWQSSPEPFCGARDMPALRDYIVDRFGAQP